MKIRVTLKDPDTMQDAVDRAMKRVDRPDGLSEVEWHHIVEQRAAAAKSWIADQWMEHGEYLVVEFDVQASTARVVPVAEQD